mmetsp:Transcript_64526/g.163471  ORF Transcript_64526/g.163471 Transcript_64526/m.163471 type:complete len:96 (-) Transcript_64526:72-359(-)
MKAWYPECGEPFELENACVAGLLAEVDKRCIGSLDKAADALERASGNLQDARLTSALESMGQCVAKVAAARGVNPKYDAEAARQRFSMSKNLLAR